MIKTYIKENKDLTLDNYYISKKEMNLVSKMMKDLKLNDNKDFFITDSGIVFLSSSKSYDKIKSFLRNNKINYDED
jgi:hypothetical protein